VLENQYELVNVKLGEGAHAKVVLAKDLTTEEKVKFSKLFLIYRLL